MIPETTHSTSSVSAKIGVVTTRILVPLWLALGAVFKMIDGSPNHLPSVLVKGLGGNGFDLHFVLQFSVGVELVVAGVMVLMPQLSRLVGLLMLGAFFPILVVELVTGAASCGCFGAVTIHPSITLATDGGFFLIVWLLGGRAPSLKLTKHLPTGRTVVAGLWVIIAFALGFGLTGWSPQHDVDADIAAGVPDYFLPDYASWVGTAWADVPLAPFITGATEDLDQGLRYLLFFRQDCEHCHELMEVFFTGPLEVPTLAIDIPNKDGFPTEGVQPFPCDGCSKAELPVGCDWFMGTPVLVRLRDGIVECAAEVTAGNPECYEW